MLDEISGAGLINLRLILKNGGYMKVKILRNTSAGGQSLEAGKVYEISEKDANILIGLKKAESVIEEINVEEKEEEKPKKKLKTEGKNNV